MTNSRSFRPALAGAAILSLLATSAVAEPRLGLGVVFGDAAPIIKLLMLMLVVSALAAVVVTATKLANGRRLAGGSTFVSALRFGGPLIGLLGAMFNVLMIFIGIANAAVEVPLTVLAPGFAEAALIFFLGLFVGVVAVICQWIIEARIDRTVLSS